MSHVVIARYRTAPGAQDEVLAHLAEMARASLGERGCRGYRVHQGTADDRTIVLYEEYEAEADFTAHCASEHFQAIVLGKVVPLLEHREVVQVAPCGEAAV
ncbi:antibiotic biosynthesis monooxygenase family protein [Streptomyces varsoviensis]|uniref:antibiotic biosynthesis monooxygenase family protein n=1 Tax=Streptomyces varsoviensis TaxID=67373 RepID=UPI0033E754A8